MRPSCNNIGDIPTIDALATLGFEGRREEWAGAMGQTQFLPSAFLAYAVDADGDGRRGADKNDFTDLLAFVRS